MSLPVLSPAQLAADKAPSVYAGSIMTFFLATIAIPLRIISRRVSASNFWWDDYFIFIAYFFASGVFATTIFWLKVGVGKHIEVVELSNPSGIVKILKSIPPAEISYTLSICFAKLSILAFYWRIFGIAGNLRKFLIALIIFVLCWTVSVVVVTLLLCVPLEALWDTSVHGKCVDLTKFYLAVAIPNIITDWFMLGLPLGYVWSLHMSLKQKISVSAFFMVGSFVCIVSLVRCISIAHLDLSDLTWGLVSLYLWTCVESFSAVFCACLPSLKPIYNLIVLGKASSHNTSAAATPGAYPKAKSGSNKGLWTATMDTTRGEHESFARLRDDESAFDQQHQHARPVSIELENMDK